MHVNRAGNGASHKEQCVNADLEDHCKYCLLLCARDSQNTSSNEEVTFILFVLR